MRDASLLPLDEWYFAFLFSPYFEIHIYILGEIDLISLAFFTGKIII